MELHQVKRLAAEIRGVGISRIRIIDPKKAAQAMTKDDVRALFKQGAVIVKPVKGTSRARARAIAKQKAKGKRRGPGSRKGAKGARNPPKQRWMIHIRAIRRALRSIKPHLVEGAYRHLYRMAKGGYFRSKSHLKTYIREKGLKRGK